MALGVPVVMVLCSEVVVDPLPQCSSEPAQIPLILGKFVDLPLEFLLEALPLRESEGAVHLELVLGSETLEIVLLPQPSHNVDRREDRCERASANRELLLPAHSILLGVRISAY